MFVGKAASRRERVMVAAASGWLGLVLLATAMRPAAATEYSSEACSAVSGMVTDCTAGGLAPTAMCVMTGFSRHCRCTDGCDGNTIIGRSIAVAALSFIIQLHPSNAALHASPG